MVNPTHSGTWEQAVRLMYTFPANPPTPSHPLSIDDTVAALEGTLLRVSVELLYESPSVAKGEVVHTPAIPLHVLQNGIVNTCEHDSEL